MKTCQTSLDRSWGVEELKGFRQTDTPKIPASFFISLQTIQPQIDYMDTAGENTHSSRLPTVTKNATWRSETIVVFCNPAHEQLKSATWCSEGGPCGPCGPYGLCGLCDPCGPYGLCGPCGLQLKSATPPSHLRGICSRLLLTTCAKLC